MNKKTVIAITFIFLVYSVLFQATAQNANDVQEHIQAGHTHDIIEVKWSPDDRRLISYSAGDGYIRLWEVKSSRLLWSARTSFIQQKDEHYTLTHFAWSPDQSLIASCSANGSVQVWEAQTGKLRWNASAHAEESSVVAFSSTGKYVASSGRAENDQAEVRLWDAITGKLVSRVTGKPGVVIAIAFSADDGTMRAATLSGEMTNWTVPDGKQTQTRTANLCGNSSLRAHRVAYNSNLSVAAARCGEQFVITETGTGKTIRTIQTGFDHNATIVFSGDGGVAATRTTGHLNLISLNVGAIKEVNAFNLGNTIDLNRDGTLLAEGGGWGDAAVKITEVATGKADRLLEGHPGIIRSLVFSPDGSGLASGGGDRIIWLWNPRNGSILTSFSGHQRAINALAFNPQGTLIVSSSQDQTMKVWDAKSGALLRTMDVSSDGIWGIQAIAFSPNGKRLVTAGENGSLKLWDTGAWNVARSFQSDSDEKSSKALSVAFSPDGAQILSGHANGTIRLWNGQTGQPIRTIKSKADETRALFTPDGKMIVCANDDDSPIRVLDAHTGQLVRTIGKAEDVSYVEGIAISPDRATIAASDSGGEISLWNLRSGKLTGKFDGGFSGDDVVAFSPDGKTFASGGRNQNILLWEVKSDGLQWSLLPLPSAEEKAAAEENPGGSPA